MNLSENDRIGLKLAAAIFINEGEISLDDMKAIPFFSEEADIRFLYSLLQETFNAEMSQVKGQSKFFPDFKEKLILNSELFNL